MYVQFLCSFILTKWIGITLQGRDRGTATEKPTGALGITFFHSSYGVKAEFDAGRFLYSSVLPGTARIYAVIFHFKGSTE